MHRPMDHTTTNALTQSAGKLIGFLSAPSTLALTVLVCTAYLVYRTVFLRTFYPNSRVQKKLGSGHAFAVLHADDETIYDTTTGEEVGFPRVVELLSTKPAVATASATTASTKTTDGVAPESASKTQTPVVEKSAPSAAKKKLTITRRASVAGTAASAAIATVEEGNNLSEDATSTTAETPAVSVCPEAKSGVSVETAGRKLALICGRSVRRELGCPSASPANRTIATQRCNAWLKEHVPNLRHSHLNPTLFRAVYVALTPSPDEIQLAEALNSPAATMARHLVECRRVVAPNRLASILPDWTYSWTSSGYTNLPAK